MNLETKHRPPLPAGVRANLDHEGKRHNYRWSWWVGDCLRVRYDAPDKGKTFRQYHRNAAGEFTAGAPPSAPTTLYGLDTLPPHGERLFICEGEKAADAVRNLGLPCVTSGSYTSAGMADWTPIQACQRCVILPDNDTPGKEYARDAVKALGGLHGPREVSIAELPDLPPKGDAADWLQARCTAWSGLGPLPVDAAEVERLRAELLEAVDAVAVPAALEVNAEEWPEPVPLGTELDAPAPYPFHALGPVLGPYAAALWKHTQAPDAVCGNAVLAAAALAAQGLANVDMPNAGIKPLSLFLLTVAESGERKSTVDRDCLEPHREMQRGRMEAYRELLRAHEIEMEAFRNLKRKGSKNGPMESQGIPPAAPLNPTLIVNDGTLQGIHRLLREGVSTCGLFNDEGAVFIGGHGLSREQFMQTVGGLSKLWDGSDYVSAFKMDGQAGHGGRRVSMHLMVQGEVLRPLWSNQLAHGQGFLARCLTAFPAGRAGTRTYGEACSLDYPERLQYLAAIRALLDTPLPRESDDSPVLSPRVLHLSMDAQDRLTEFQNNLEPHLAPGNEFAHVKAFASKAAEQGIRIAGVLALTENPNAPAVELRHMESGITLAEFYLAEHLRLSAWDGTRPEVGDAARLREWLLARGQGEIARREIQQHGPHCLRDKARLDPAIGVLVDFYHLRPACKGARCNRWEFRAA